MTRSTVPRLWFFDADEDESLGVHDVLREHNKGGASRATRIIGGTAVMVGGRFLGLPSEAEVPGCLDLSTEDRTQRSYGIDRLGQVPVESRDPRSAGRGAKGLPQMGPGK